MGRRSNDLNREHDNTANPSGLRHSASRWDRTKTGTARWRTAGRLRDLQVFARRSRHLRWSTTLLQLLLEELYISDDFERLVGPIRKIPIERYPHAVAVALALRHSWHRDDLSQIAAQLGFELHRSSRR